MIVQLTSYGILWWLAFVLAAFTFARVGAFRGTIAGQVLIAVLVMCSDIAWIQREMHKPGWDGQPDQDAVFMVGVLIRIILINVCLLPVSALGCLSRRWPTPKLAP